MIAKRHVAATNIQRVVCGYIVSAHTFDLVYRIILVQAKMRGNIIRDRIRRLQKEIQLQSAIQIQCWWRCQVARASYRILLTKIKSATRIQAWWRCTEDRVQYQYLIVDVIIVQSTIRRWRCRCNYIDYIQQPATT